LAEARKKIIHPDDDLLSIVFPPPKMCGHEVTRLTFIGAPDSIF
jgi:hypothetical protein